MNNIYYITYLSEEISEGGMARNHAFSEKMFFIEKKRLNIFLYKKNFFARTFKGISFLLQLVFCRNKIVFAHQSALFFVFPLLTRTVSQNFFKILLSIIAKNNKLIIEVNDLPYEQSIDLELPVFSYMKKLEKALYTIPNCYYIFASNEMRRYVSEKYKIKDVFSEVVINGGPDFSNVSNEINLKDNSWVNSDKIKYVYAGSLNKGRQIEDLICTFNKNPDRLLILIGVWGEWIQDLNLSKNIIFLGNFNEKDAQSIVSLCDIGLIPYDESKFYYNLCYPTKASFYITSGIPFLSTPLLELQSIFSDLNIAYFVSFEKWKEFVRKTDKSSLVLSREEVKLKKDKFKWEYLIDKCFRNFILAKKAEFLNN